MIHFVPPHLDKVRAKVSSIAPGVDVLLANLEDAIPADAKDAARAGAVEIGKMYDFQAKGTGFWGPGQSAQLALVSGRCDRADL